VTAEHPHATADRLAADLRLILGPDAVHRHQPLARYTALRVGGPADVLAVARDGQSLCRSVQAAWEQGIPARVLGSGSNVLVSDAGFRGLVILNRTRSIRFLEASVRAESGVSLSTLAHQCVRRGLAGLEWAAGIPGTVGGAIVGNAGAWGGDVASTLIRATILAPDGAIAGWPVSRLEYGYRTSLLKRQNARAAEKDARNSGRAIVVDAEFALQPSEREALTDRVAEITAQRKASQPPGASCGSVFKNPPGDYAGRLIEAAGLKGHHLGAVEISAMHANFMVNHGGATAADIWTMISLARRRVWEQFGVELELEIERIGDW